MKQTFTFLSEDSDVRALVNRLSLLLVINGSLYPLWAKVHFMVDPNAVDSYFERLLVYGLILLLVAVARFSKLTPWTKLHLLIANRWVVMAHYFSLLERNHGALNYMVPVFFFTFFFSGAFEKPKTFLPYAFFVLGCSFLVESNNEHLPTFFFRASIATCLLLSFFVMYHRYQLTRAIRANEKMLRDMFMTAGVGMAILDLKGKIVAVNHALARTLGLSEKNIAGRQIDDFRVEKGTRSFEKELGSLVAKEIPAVKQEIGFAGGAGETVWGKVSATVIESTSSFVLALVEDISSQKAAELLIRDRQEKMHYSARMAALGEMAGGIAHEINNPLAIIDVTANVLRNKIAKRELDLDFAREALEKVQKMSDRIAKIIRGLRSFSRDGSRDASQLHTTGELLQNTLDLCEEKLKSNQISLRVNRTPKDYVVRCRGVEVSQVLLNIINNAFDAVAQQNEKWIEVDVAKEDKFVRVDILNSGPKVPNELQQKIFQPFFTTKPIGQGVGLGLSISLGIMNSQGGRLQLDPTRPNTCFSVWIPRDLEHSAFH